MNITELAKSFAFNIGGDCLWNEELIWTNEVYYVDCISASWMFYRICQLYLWIDIEIRTWSLREWLFDWDEALENNWHYWCEYDWVVYDFTVSQFRGYIEYEWLTDLFPYGSFIYDKKLMNENNLYMNWLNWFNRCRDLNNNIANYWKEYYNDFVEIIK